MDEVTPLAVDRRVSTRQDYNRVMDYTPDANVKGKICKGVTVNISDSGLCLYVFTPLAVGQEIRIESVLVGRGKIGRICWLKMIDEGVYKAGLEFTEKSNLAE